MTEIAQLRRIRAERTREERALTAHGVCRCGSPVAKGHARCAPCLRLHAERQGARKRTRCVPCGSDYLGSSCPWCG